MKNAIRATAFSAAAVLTVSSLAGCSAYNNPTKYITPPEKGAVQLQQSEIDSQYEDEIADILEDYRETEFILLEDETALVQKGDSVNITYTGASTDSSVTISDESLANMTNADVEGGTDLIIGSGSFIGEYTDDDGNVVTAGFEDQLIGAKKGDVVTVLVTFPDSYSSNTELQGVAVTFTVEINSISRTSVSDKNEVTISYTFADITETEVKSEEEETTSEEASSEEETSTEASEQSETEGDTSGATDESSDTSIDSSLGDDDDELEFSDLFTDSQFTYDFADPDEDETFNDLFNNAEYAELFKGAALYSVIVKEYVIPDDVSSSYSSLAGHTIEITLTLDDCTYLPDWTDELVADYTSDTYTTVEDYKDYLVTSIIADLAFDAIVEATVVDTYPKKELKASYKSYVDQYVYQELGESVSNYTQSELDELISDDDYATIYAESAANAVTAVKQRLVLEYLISYYNITLTKSEYNEKLDEAYTSYAYYYYYYYGVSSADELETYYGKDYFELQFKSEKLNDYLSDYVTIVE